LVKSGRMLIAETEIASANSEGALAGYEEAANEGISVKKSWLILDDACDDCQENADAGAIDLDESSQPGMMLPRRTRTAAVYWSPRSRRAAT
jgi:hypothetical protein